MKYSEFIRTKERAFERCGFEPTEHVVPMWQWQRDLTNWAIRKGRAALFEECGLGKTRQQIEWLRQVVARTGKPGLILCPLAVANQTVKEAEACGVGALRVKDESEIIGPDIYVTNYHRLDHFQSVDFGGVVLDESSILKSFEGAMRQMITERFSQTAYRLCCTATPAPNDHTELGQHAEFLGICKSSEMLASFFINDTYDTGTWRLKGHARAEFWRWVASWASCVRKPSDIGGSDEGYDLPKVDWRQLHIPDIRPPGENELFASDIVSATDLHSELRRTLEKRCSAVALIVNTINHDGQFVVWCESNEESALLAKLIDDCVEVKGSDSIDTKEARLDAFTNGEVKTIVTKPSIAGMGVNWQHVHNEIYVSFSYSNERFYQASKRLHRFGQKYNVNRWMVATPSMEPVIAALKRKQSLFDELYDMVEFTKEELFGPRETKPTDHKMTTKAGRNWTMHHGDCVDAIKLLGDDSIGFSIFSPPFADLFTYSDDIRDMGNCSGLPQFMKHFNFLVEELKRVMEPGRHVAIHCCDLLSAKWKDGYIGLKDFSGKIATAMTAEGFIFHSRIAIWKSPVTEMQRTKAHGLLYKTLRKDSADSRVGSADYLLVFRKPGKNGNPIEHTPDDLPLSLWQEIASPVWMTVDQGRVLNGKIARCESDERHICPLQLDVIDRALLLWTNPGDVVLSPFAGIGSEGYESIRKGRKFVGFELKESYFKHACEFLEAAEAESDDLFKARADSTEEQPMNK